MNKKESGLAPIAVILIVAGILALAGGIYFWQKSEAPEQAACTLEAKVCPDGASVGRTGPDCEFAACPSTATSTVGNSNASSTASAADVWKRYVNKQYGFTVDFPPFLEFLENPVTPEQYLYSVSFENPLAAKIEGGKKIVFNVSVFKDNAQLLDAFKSLTLDDMGKVSIGGYEAKKLFAPKGRVLSVTEATVYTIAAKNVSLIFYGADFSEVSDAAMAKILSSFAFAD